MKKLYILILVLIILGFKISPAQGDLEKQMVLNVSEKATSLANSGYYDDAIRIVEDNIQTFTTKEFKDTYLSFMYFNLGHLYENNTSSKKSENLKNSIIAYERALNLQADDKKIIKNLVHVHQALDDHSAVIKYSQKMIDLEPDNLDEWYVILGDAYKSEGDYNEAWKSYSKASDLNPKNQLAIQKILQTYESYSVDNVPKLYDKCVSLRENGQDEMARIGLEKILQQYCQKTEEYQEKIILEWAAIVINNGWIDKQTTTWIEKTNCDYAALNDILLMTKGDIEGWNNSSWWTNNERRLFYKNALQKSYADYLLSQGEKKKAMQIYIQTRKELKRINDYSKEIYDQEDVLEMEVLIQLARLYSDKDLDPNGRNFAQLESELFDEKGQAYRTNDLKSIQKFHTILAFIYVGQNKWESDRFARNAIFQLERATQSAKRLAIKNPENYQPLPNLYSFLGEGYEKIGREKESKNAYLDAAIDYLETDHLASSKKAIDKVSGDSYYRISRSLLPKLNDVEKIYTTRVKIEHLSAQSFEKNEANYYEKDADFDWIKNNSDIKTIDASIVNRQAFKATIDMSVKARDLGKLDAYKSLQVSAQLKANDVKIASSQEDLIRAKLLERPDLIKKSNYLSQKQYKSQYKLKE